MQWFTNLPIGRKLALGFGALATTVLLIGGIGISVARAINDRMLETFATHALPTVQLKEANVRLLVISRAVRNAILDTDAATIRGRQAEIALADSAFRADFAAYRTKVVRPEQQQIAARVQAQFDALRPQQDAIVALALAGDDDAARAKLPAIRQIADSIDAELDTLTASKLELMHAAMEAASRSAALGITSATAVLVVALLAAVGIGLAISRPITRGLTALGDAATAAARGDVDVSIDVSSRDEVGQLADGLRALMASQREMATAARSLSRGDLEVTIAPRSEADMLGHAFVDLRTTTRTLVADVTRFADAARRGDLSIRGDATAFAGAYGTLVSTLNGLLDAVEAPMRETSSVMSRIAARDLSARMEGTYNGEFATIAASVNQAADALDHAISDVGDAAAQVASAGQQIAGGSQSLAEGTSRQSASLEEIGSSVEEMSAMTVQTAANLKQARQMSDAARQRVEEGRRSMDALSTAIAEIRRSSDETARVAKTIEEIAFQTNLLALNAAVEAARAGDAGRGFSVVAEEVRALATRSAEAAKTSTTLIDGAIEQSRRGVALKEEVLGRLAAIDQDVSRVTALVGEIAEAGEQQRAGIGQINSAVEQLNGVTQGAAANAEESAAAAQELAAQSMSLNELVGRFTTSAQASQARRHPTASAPKGHAAAAPHRPSAWRRPAAQLAAW